MEIHHWEYKYIDPEKKCCGFYLKDDFNCCENMFQLTLNNISRAIPCNECKPNSCYKYKIGHKDCGTVDCDGFCPIYIAGLPILLIVDILCGIPCKSYIYCRNYCCKNSTTEDTEAVITTQPTKTSL